MDKPIPSEKVAEKISQILDRFYFEQGWNIKRTTDEEKAEHTNRVKFWMQILASEKIPVAEFDEIYLRCISNRVKAKANGQTVAVKLNPEDFSVAWLQIKSDRQQAEIEANKQAEAERKEALKYRCNYYGHDTRTGMMKVVNPFNFDEDILLPCAYCRPSEYQEARANFINTSGEIKPLDILTQLVSDKEN